MMVTYCISKTRHLLILVLYITLTTCTQPTIEDMLRATSESKPNPSAMALGICLDDVEGNFTILYYKNDGIIIGRNNKPYMLIANYAFDLSGVPTNLKPEVLQIRAIKLQPSLFFGRDQNEIGTIPDWIANFKKLEYLTLESACVNSLSVIDSSSLRYLVLVNTRLESSVKLKSEISLFKNLRYIVYNKGSNFQDMLKLDDASTHLTILTEDEFQRRVRIGEMRIVLE